MSSEVHAVKWHQLDAWELENDALKVVILPAPGGKLVSIYDKHRAVEWLAQPSIPPAAALHYGMAWDGPASYGWDEMMPTIVACDYPGEEAAEDGEVISLPDHGEVWTQPWQVDASRESVTVRCAGRMLPYQLERRARLEAPDKLVLEYTVYNDGSAPLQYLWAAHPLFWCEPGAEIVLPPAVDQVVNVMPLAWGPEWGPPGTRNVWPAAPAAAGALRQDLVRETALRPGRKFFVPPEAHVTWAGLWRPAVQSGLQMTWDAGEMPYCGVWIDEGAVFPVHSEVALEPTNGYYDSLALAAANRRVAMLAPGARRTWQVTVRVGASRPPFEN